MLPEGDEVSHRLDARLSVQAMMTKPTHFQALIAKILAVTVGISTLGGAILMWEDLRPWTTVAEHEAAQEVQETAAQHAQEARQTMIASRPRP